jgi:putative ABC transport system permease protein
MNDVRFALRQLRKSPGFTALALLTLALGIGACTAIFTVVNSVILRPLDYPESERLMIVRETNLPQFPEFSVSPANYRDYAQAEAFASVYAVQGASYNLTGRGEPVRVIGQRVSSGMFDVLGVKPALGRAFTAEEDVAGKGNVVVLSHGFWQKQFAGSPDAIGQTINLNNTAFTIIGVMPANFRRGTTTEVYAPLAFNEQQWANRGGHFLTAFARLKPGYTHEQARIQLETIAARLAEQYPDTNKNWGVLARPWQEYATGDIRPTLLALLGAVGFLLLIACANVANLLLARATARQREVSVRAALGASRWHIIRQLLAESLLLSALGGLLGILVGQLALKGMLAIAPQNLPRAAEIALDGRALLFTVGVALLTGVGFGLVPAWQSLKINLVDALKDGARGTGDGRRHFVRSGLVVLEVALALVLLTGAGLLMRSFVRLASANPGFNPEHAIWVSVVAPGSKYNTPEKQTAFLHALLERFRALPGVQHVGASHVMPFSGQDYVLGLEIEGRPVPQSELPSTNYFSVSPGYFQAMGIPLLRGRDFTEADRAGAARVAIVSQAFADTFFPNENPLGKRIHMTNGPTTWREIVGVVAEIKHARVDLDTPPQSYEPLAQYPFTGLNFVIRTAGDPAGLLSAIRREVYAVDPDQPVARTELVTTLFEASMARQRFAMTLFIVFSGLALLLAAIGIYGVMAYAVTQRTNEFGVRLAIGASPRDILGLVLREGGRLAALGIVAGLLGSLAAGQAIQSMLYQTGARDPLVFAAIAALLAVVALLACLVPALRATRVDPQVALRAQ